MLRDMSVELFPLIIDISANANQNQWIINPDSHNRRICYKRLIQNANICLLRASVQVHTAMVALDNARKHVVECMEEGTDA
jgi:hypothetical protein